ncbi:MAG: hypothetical protein RIC89_21035 [Pseudomonadales bacterium]
MRAGKQGQILLATTEAGEGLGEVRAVKAQAEQQRFRPPGVGTAVFRG